MNSLKIVIETFVHPTEDLDKVKIAVGNLINNPTFEIILKDGKKKLFVKASGRDALTKIYELIKQDRIRDAARRIMIKGLQGRKIIFYVNKQAAYVKHISFCDPVAESPLGPITVKLLSNDPKGLIDWISPKTDRRKRSK